MTVPTMTAPGPARKSRGSRGDTLSWSIGGFASAFSRDRRSLRDPASGYLPADFDRLVELKRRYDLKNVLRINHDIDPTINEARRTA
jgi:hypothetical protein